MLKAFSKHVFCCCFFYRHRIKFHYAHRVRCVYHSICRENWHYETKWTTTRTSHIRKPYVTYEAPQTSAQFSWLSHTFFSRPSLASCCINLCNLNPCHCLALFMINAQTVTRASTGLHRLTQVEGNPKRRYCCRIWALHCLDKLSAAVKTPRRRRRDSGREWKITFCSLCVAQSVRLTGKMHPSSLSPMMTHFPSSAERGGAGKNRRRMMDIWWRETKKELRR